MAAISYLPRYLDNPDQIPIEDIPQILDATANTIAATRLSLEYGFDLVHTARAIQQMERTETLLKQRLLNHVRQQTNLPAIDVAQYEAENGLIDPHALYASLSHGDDNAAAFSVPGALSVSTKQISLLKQVYELMLQIITVVSPVTGIRPVTARSNSAYQRNIAITWKAVYKPDLLYMALFTRAALALLLQETRAAQVQDPDLDEVLQNPSVQRFLENKEDEDAPVHERDQSGYVYCTTQSQESIASLVVGGISKGQISLWKDNTVLTWRLVDETFETQQQFTYAERAMQASTAAWNRILPGGVTFERAESVKDATFKVRFVKKKGNTAAKSFFPARYVKNVSSIDIFPISFLNGVVQDLSKILCHELGHVLGFRHEFALETERRSQAGRFGAKDPHSVMSYKHPPFITIRDVTTSRSVYQHFQGAGEYPLSNGRGKMIKFTVVRKDPLSAP